ncbi:protein translocase subunit SecDF [Mycoplasmopsis lipofaciens]|uniref:protein translocase subunit SecDF n=1 Tax=Mycoplasmopsis lipofaciens TaxID=114884 RepID=UPI0005633B89|nr:protein translocase subunit SecDF [Mycoplasmopsis lipofaciens]
MWDKIVTFFKKMFSLTNWKRWVIAAITIISTIIAIVFGSLFYISKNVNKSVEYGGGVEFLVEIKKENGEKIDDKFANTVASALDNRLTGGIAFNGTNVAVEGEGKIRITRNGDLNDTERKQFEKIISSKPSLVLTDPNMMPLFVNGKFVEGAKIDYDNIDKYIPPLKPDGATFGFGNQQNGSNNYAVTIELANSDAEIEWTKATSYVVNHSKTILMWLNLDDLVNNIAKKEHKAWIESGENPFNFVHVNNKTYDEKLKKPNILKEHEFNAKNYLISLASVNRPLNGSKFNITGNFTDTEAKKLAANINFGSSKYDLVVLSSNYISSTRTGDSFRSALLAGLVVFSLISIFMIVNYGLLGALSTISIALYIFLTLLMFTVLRGEYSPITIAALIIGIGISVDANIITFERLKNEIYNGEKLKKSIKNSNKMTLSSIVDANLTTLIVSFILFYFGTRVVRGFSISLVFSVIFTLVVMLFFTRVVSAIIVGTGFFDNRLWLLGLHKNKINNLKMNSKYRTFDYVKHAKWFIMGSLLFIFISIIVFTIFASINKEFWAGFNRSMEFQGGINVTISGNKDLGVILDKSTAENIKNYIISNHANLGINNPESVTNVVSIDSAGTSFNVVIKTTQDLNSNIQLIKNNLLSFNSNLSIISYGISSTEARNLVNNALTAIGVSFVGIILYTLIRLKWTFSLAAIIGLLHDVAMTIGFIVIARLELSPIIVAAALSIIAFSINDTIVVFDRIRETITNDYHNMILDKNKIKSIANSAVVETIKRSIFTSLTTITTVLVLLSFGNATDLSFNIVMIFGLAIGAYSSIFICTWLWTKFELIRQKGIKKRTENHFWDLPGVSEQTFQGINDFIA